MAKISVILPVYNSGQYIEKCISRIVNQTMKDIEILALDNGSTDQSLDLLEKLSDQYKGKIKVFTKLKTTMGALKNMGTKYATGDWVYFAHPYQLFEPYIFEKMNQIIKEQNVSLIRGTSKKVIGPIKMKNACNWSGIRINILIDIEKNKDYLVTERPELDNKLIKREYVEDLTFLEQNIYEDLSVMPIVMISSKQIFHMETVMYEDRKSIFNKTEKLIDLIQALDLAQIEMEKRNLLRTYRYQLESFYIFHILQKVVKIMFLVNISYHKKQLFISTLLGILDDRCPNWEDNQLIKYYQSRNPLFDYSMKQLEKFIKKEYRNIEDTNIQKRLQL